MPSKTKYRNRKNKTRKYKNRTKRCRQRRMRGGDPTSENKVTDNSEQSNVESPPSTGSVDTNGDMSTNSNNEQSTPPTGSANEGQDNLEKSNVEETSSTGSVDTNGDMSTNNEKDNDMSTNFNNETESEGEGNSEQQSTSTESVVNNLDMSTNEVQNMSTTIYKYGSTESTTVNDIEGKTYETIIGEDTPFIVLIDGVVNENPAKGDTIPKDNSSISIYTYKYKNNVGEPLPENIPTATITDDDVMDFNPQDANNVSEFGTKIAENYYIDGQGVLRIYNVENNIKKVVLTELPSTESLNLEGAGEGDLEKQLSNVFSNIFQKIQTALPEYMIINFNNNSYIISKETPYIIVNSE
jgi:hypothetical protein